jgi:hypothetical protein
MWKLFLNPSVLLALLVLMATSSTVAYWRGSVNKENAMRAGQLSADLVREETFRAAMAGTAALLSKQATKQVNITRTLEKEVRVEPRYINCRHSPDAWRMLVDAHRAAGLAEPVSGGELSTPDRAAE